MFNRLRNHFILINLITTSIILLVAFVAIYCVAAASANTRPLPPRANTEQNLGTLQLHDSTFTEQIRSERQAALNSLLFSLIVIGLIVECVVAIFSYVFADAAIQPIKTAYDSQRTFIANSSHEIKTPLAAICANLEAADIKNNHFIDNVAKEVETLTALNQQLLTLAQAEQLPHDASTSLASDAISNLLDSFSAQLKQKHLAPDVQLEAPNLHLPTSDFHQVATILIDNAIKYSDDVLKISLTPHSFKITNDGTTINPDEVPHIFERFYQTDKTSPGVGLGLSIAKAIADRNHWQLTVSSEQLTTFELNF